MFLFPAGFQPPAAPEAAYQQPCPQKDQPPSGGKGCQILSAKSPDAQHPVPDQELRPQIRNPCRLGSLLVVLILLGLESLDLSAFLFRG